jgi:O-antigen ligase
MIAYIRQNLHFVFILLIWLFSGIYLDAVVFGVIVITMLLLRQRRMYEELFLGFFFILILSDSRQYALWWASNIKDVYILLLALFLIIDRDQFQPLNKMFRSFILFFIVALFSLILYGEVKSVNISLQKTLSYFLLILIVPNYITLIFREKGTELFRHIVFFICTLLVAGIFLKYTKPETVMLVGRFTGILGNPNGLGIFCFMFFLVFSVMLKLRPELFSRKDRLIVFGLIFVSVIMSGSRSSIFAILLFWSFVYFYRLSPLAGFLSFAGIIVAYEVITSNIEPIIIALGLQDFFRIETLKEGSGRFVAWEFAWDNIKQQIFIGKGFTHNEYLFAQNDVYLSFKGHQGNVHNSYLTFWLDTGLIGVVSYLVALVAQFIKAARRSPLAMPVLYAIFFSANYESWLTASLNPFTIQMFIILTITSGAEFYPGEVAEEEQEDAEQEDDQLAPAHSS